jgi:hypothetical protein
MQPVTKTPTPLKLGKNKKHSFIFFDLETTQDLVVGHDKNGEVKKHVVNCVCYEKVCDLCYEQPILMYPNCLEPNRKHTFVGTDAFDEFCAWLMQKRNGGSFVIAHNARGFDGQFLLEWMQRKGFPPKSVLMRGLNIVTMDFLNMRLLDSLNFLPMALSALPKALGFDAAKGSFPHLFNTMDNYEYRGPYPEPEMYGVKGMKPKQKQEFMKWFVFRFV